jgi:predicted nucleic acid-binding protein
MNRAIVDTGPLVAAINANDRSHDWTVEKAQGLAGPLVTCEAVISEACFLLAGVANGTGQLWSMVKAGGVLIDFSLPDEIEGVSKLMSKYADLPMSLADACLVRMSELFAEHVVLTIDSDFKIYRRYRNRSVPVVMPPNLK